MGRELERLRYYMLTLWAHYKKGDRPMKKFIIVIIVVLVALLVSFVVEVIHLQQQIDDITYILSKQEEINQTVLELFDMQNSINELVLR